jgi:hypothetical protein
MNKATRVMLKTSLAAGAATAIMASTLLFALPAAAMVTGYDTGYTYRQGLAIGAGAQLERQAGLGSGPATSQINTSAVSPSGSGVSAAPTSNAVAPAVQTAPETAVAPAVNPAQNTAVAPAAQTATAGLSTPVKVALWAVIILAVLALIGGGIAALNRTDREERATRPYYQG